MIEYLVNAALSPRDIVRVYELSGIIRPTGDLPRIARMYAGSNMVISAWSQGTLIGVCRALTDFSYCCYLSDLAVIDEFQGQGVGTRLVEELRSLLSDEVALILLSAPGAMSYYPRIGFSPAENGVVIRR